MSNHSGFTATGDIDLGGNTILDGGNPWYGTREYGAYELSATAATSVGSGGVYALMAGTMIQSVATSQFTVSGNRVTYTGAGTRIKVTVHASIQATNNLFTVTMAPHKNGSVQSPVSKQYIHTANVDHGIALSTILSVSSGDILDLRLKTDSGVTQSVTVSALGLTLEVVA